MTAARALTLILVLLVTASLLSIYLHRTPSHETIRLRIATTTSLYATGLLDALSDRFRHAHPNIVIDYIPVGSGEALRRAEDGTVCMVLVHAPSLEKQYIVKGVISNQTIFAYNYFVVVGPRDDPAGVSEASSAVDAFKRIYCAGIEGRAKFVSRGDGSGTHIRERLIWRLAGLDPEPGRDKWYIETGSGMASTLRIADELRAYTLSDIGTFAKLAGDNAIHNLVILYTNASELVNVYSAYIVSSCQGEELSAAKAFLAFLSSDEAQNLIEKFGVEKYGVHLFYPARGKLDELRRAWVWLSELG